MAASSWVQRSRTVKNYKAEVKKIKIDRLKQPEDDAFFVFPRLKQNDGNVLAFFVSLEHPKIKLK